MIPAPESVRFATSVTPAPGQLTVLFINFIGFYTTLEGYLIRAGAYPQDRSTLRRPRGDAGASANVYCNAVISCLSILSPRVAICQLHLSPPPPPLHHRHPRECLVAFFPLFFSLLFFFPRRLSPGSPQARPPPIVLNTRYYSFHGETFNFLGVPYLTFSFSFSLPRFALVLSGSCPFRSPPSALISLPTTRLFVLPDLSPSTSLLLMSRHHWRSRDSQAPAQTFAPPLSNLIIFYSYVYVKNLKTGFQL